MAECPELTEKAAVEGLAAKIKAACPNKDMKIYYLLSLAYGKGSSLNTDMDLTRDTYHMDYGRARFTASELMFESLISTSEYGKGVKLDNTTYRITENNTESGTYCSPVDDAAAKICLKAARAAIAKPFEVTKISE